MLAVIVIIIKQHNVVTKQQHCRDSCMVLYDAVL